MIDVAVIGAGPAGMLAAIRAADLGARTALVSSAEFGGMAANDGPVPVRTLGYAARLIGMRGLGQNGTARLSQFSITVSAAGANARIVHDYARARLCRAHYALGCRIRHCGDARALTAYD